MAFASSLQQLAFSWEGVLSHTRSDGQMDPQDMPESAMPVDAGIQKSTSTTGLNTVNDAAPLRGDGTYESPRVVRRRPFRYITQRVAPAAEKVFSSHFGNSNHVPYRPLSFNHARGWQKDLPRSPCPRFSMDHFGFKRRKDRLNWRMLSGIHVDSIIREVDIAALQEIIDNVAYCDIESEDLRQIDPNMIKLFQLSQLIIEYLLYSQDYLSHSYQTASEELKQVTESNTELQGTLNTVMGELDAAKRDNKTLKKGLFAYQVAAKLPQKSSHQNVAGHCCKLCPKIFSSQFYLENHIQRKHKEFTAPDKSQPNEAKQVIRIIEKQTSTSGLKEVEDSVKTADIVKDSVLPVIDEKISGIILQLKADMTNREKDIRKQFDEQLISELEAQKKLLQEQFKLETLNHQRELQNLKSAVHAEISQERAILQEEQNQVHALLESAKAQPRSYLGNLEDEDDSAEMQTEQKINTLQIQQEIEGMVRQSQDETRLEAHEILTQFKQTQMNFLELLGEKFEGELQEMKQSLQIVQERDRKDLNEKIANTTSQLLMLQDIMLNTRKEDQKDSKPVAENAVRELLRSSTTSQIVKYDNLEQKPRTSISEARKLSIKEMVDQIAVQSSQPTLQVSTAVPDVLAFFKDHIYSPGPLNPWVKSVFPHSIEEINEERALIEHKVQADMNLWDVTPESTGHTWGNDPSVAIEYEKKQITLKLEVSQKCQRDEDYARAYQYMEQELDVFVKAIFDRKLPPPIVTERRESNSSVDTPISTGTNRISLDKQVQFQNSGAIDEQIQQTFKRQTFSSLEVKDPKKISKMLEVTLESNKPQNEHSKKHLNRELDPAQESITKNLKDQIKISNNTWDTIAVTDLVDPPLHSGVTSKVIKAMNIETQLSLQQNVKVAENKVIASPIEAMKPPLPSSRPPVPVFTNTSHNIKQIQNDQPNLIKRKPVITNAEERRDMLSTDITSSDGLSEESTRPQGRQHAERDVIIVKSDFAQERPTTRNNTENTEKNRESKKNIDRSGNDTQVIEVSEGSQSSDDVSTDWPEGSSILDEDELIESNSNRFSSKNTSPLLSLGHKVHSTHTILEEEEYTSESSEEVEVHEKEQQPRKPSAFESENSTTNREQQPRKPSAFESENSTTNRERQKIQEHNNFNKPRDNLLIEESKISALQKEENSFDVSELSSSQELESSSTSLSSLKLKNQMQQIASVVQNAKPIDLSDDESNFSDLDDIEDFSFSRPAQVHSAGLYGKHANVPQNGAAVSVNPTRGIPNRQLEEDDEFDFDLDD